MTAMLEVRNLSVAYGGLRALTDVSISVAAGQFVTVVGPNGAGKSTLFKAISGVVPPVSRSRARTCWPRRHRTARIWVSRMCRRGGRSSRP